MKSTKVSIGLVVVLAIFTVTLLATSTRVAAQEVVLLHSFGTGTGDGKEPSGGVTFVGGTHLYGTTAEGGSGLGTVFELAEKGGVWNETIPYDSFSNTEGDLPSAHLLSHDGKLYGTTPNGGSAGYGTVFELTYTPGTGPGTGWNQTFGHSFTGNTPNLSPDGQYPGPNLIFANGNIYGTTFEGGSNINCGTSGDGGSEGCGTVFQLAPVAGGGWTESVVYNFLGTYEVGGVTYFDAQGPVGIIFDEGEFYGTAGGGVNGEGRVFELNPTTWLETIVHDFTPNQGSNTDGAVPTVGLAVDTAHNLYGTTSQGGTNNAGVVFELTSQTIRVGGKLQKVWTETPLHYFDSTVDGSEPSALIVDKNFNLYGTTGEGGPNYGGTAFELPAGSTPSSPPLILYSFCDAFAEACTATDGQFPSSGLTFDTAYNLYGTTLEGGANGYGTVFAIILNNFALSATPSTMSIEQGLGASSTILVADVGGFAGTVNLKASGLPKGVTASFSSSTITGNGASTLTLTASPTAKIETGATVTITGSSGTLQQVATINVSVIP